MAGSACRLPVPEPYHAGPLHRDARPYRRRGRAPAHRLLGGRLDREPHLRGRVQLPGDGGLCRPAFLHARPGAAGLLHRRGSAPHRLYALPAGAGGSAHRGHRQPGGEGEAHLRLCHPERPVSLPAVLFRPRVHRRELRPQPPGRLRHHGADLHHPLPHRGHPGPVGERLCSGPGGRGLSRLGAVLRRPRGLDVCRLLLRCLHGPPGR